MFLFFYFEILNLEGHQNRFTASRVTAILLNGWILLICGALAGECLLSTGPTPSSLSTCGDLLLSLFPTFQPPSLRLTRSIFIWPTNPAFTPTPPHEYSQCIKGMSGGTVTIRCHSHSKSLVSQSQLRKLASATSELAGPFEYFRISFGQQIRCLIQYFQRIGP